MASRKQKPVIIRPTEEAAVRGAITTGLQSLAGVCDWATTRDNVGFNSSDTATGPALADWSARAPLTDLELIIGYRLLRKYERTQLSKVGIVLPEAATVSALFGPDIDIDRAKDQFEGAIRLSRNDAGAEIVLVVFEYNESKQYLLKQCVKPFGYASFTRNPSGHGGYWTCPVASVHAIAERFPAFARTAEVTERLKQPPAEVAPPVQARPPHQGTWTRMRELPQAQPAAPTRPLGTIALDGNEVTVKIEALWEADRAQALRAKDQCKAYCQIHGGRGYDGGARVWRINQAATLALTKAFPTFHQTDDVKNLASEQMHRIRHAA